MPKATDSRNEVFMTDQGSTRVNRSRARRVCLPPDMDGARSDLRLSPCRRSDNWYQLGH